MNSIIKLIPKQNIYIIDSDYYYALTIKYSLNKKFGEEVFVHVFRNVESFMEDIKKTATKPQIVLMDHAQNKEIVSDKVTYAIDDIHNLSTDITIIILSDEKSKDHAIKTLAHGAQGFVVKDQFALEHIFSTVDKCLHPTKV